MKLRKALAILLSIAMMASLIVEPTSAVEVVDTATLAEILPATGSTGSTVYESIATIGATTISGDTTAGFGKSIPAGGAVHYAFSSLTAAGGDHCIVFNEDLDGTAGAVNIGLATAGVADTATAFRIRTWENNAAAYKTLATYAELDFSQAFEIIVKDAGNNTLEYWLKANGEDEFALVGEYAPENHNGRTSLYSAKGTAVANLASATMYGASAYYETGSLADILPSDGKVGDTVFTSVAEVEETTLNSSTSTTFDRQIPLGGAVHYKFDNVRVTSSILGGANCVVLNETVEGGGAANNMVLAPGTASATPTQAIRIREGSTYRYPAGYNILDFSQAFEIIVKHNRTSSKFEYWLKSNGEDNFKFLGEFAPENNTRTSSHSINGVAVGDGFSAVMYGTTVIEEPEEPEIVYETATEEELLPKTGNEGDYIFTEFKTIEEDTVNSSTALTFGEGASLPLNGALHYKFGSITGAGGGAKYITIQQDIAGDGDAGLYIPIASTATNMIQTQIGQSHIQIAGTDLVNLADGFELIIKISGSTAGSSSVDYWLKTEEDGPFKLIKENAAVGFNSRRGSSITAIGTASATVSAVMYQQIFVQAPYPTASEEHILPKTGDEGEMVYASYKTIANTTLDSTNTQATFGSGVSIPLNGALHYKFGGISGAGNAKNYITIMQDIAGDGAAGLYIPLGFTDTNMIQAHIGTKHEQIAENTVVDISKPFELIITIFGDTETSSVANYWVKADGESEFKLIYEGAAVGANNSRGSSIAVTGTASTTVSAVMYQIKEVPPERTLDEIITTTDVVGEYTHKAIGTIDRTTLEATTPTTTSFGKSIPVGGAVRYKFDGMTAASSVIGGANNIVINEDIAGDSAGAVNICLGAGIESSGQALRIRTYVDGAAKYMYLADYETLDFSKPFEIIVKHTDAGNIQYWLKSNGSDSFTLIGEYAPENHNSRSSAHTASGTAIGNGFSAVMYEFSEVLPPPPEKTEAEIITTTDVVGQYSHNAVGKISATTIGGETTTSFGKSIPVNGAVHYKFSSVTTNKTGGQYVVLNEDLDGSSAGGVNLTLAASTSSAFRIKAGTEYAYLANYNDLDFSKPFEIIVKHTASGTIQYWLKSNGRSKFILLGEYSPESNNGRNSSHYAGDGAVAYLTEAIMYEYAEVQEGFTEKTAEEILTTSETVGKYTHKSVARIGTTTIAGETPASFGKSVPDGGAVHYVFGSVSARGGEHVIVINEDWDGTNGAINLCIVPDTNNALRLRTTEDGNHKYIYFGKELLDVTQGFEIIVKDTNNAENPIQYWLKANGSNKFRLIGEYAPENHNSRPSSISASGTASANLVSATMYSYEMVVSNFAETSLDDILPTTGKAEGSGTYELSNGHHQLLLTHTPTEVTYLTADGEQTFEGGLGDFNIITQGAVADVYRNGQFAFSYLMPQTYEVSQSYTEEGLDFSNESLSVPQERGTYFSAEDITAGRYTYRLPSLPYIYRTVFVADYSDNVRVAVNDSLFRTDVEIANGKIYAWTVKLDASPAERVELCNAVNANNVYYHIETVGGMNRIYGNGKWLSSFRSINSVGEQSILIEVSSGDLSYVNVTDNQDVFIYNDDFSNSGEFSPIDYWQATGGMETYYNGVSEQLELFASGYENAVAEITAYAGDQSLSADLEVEYSTGGVWMVFQHSHTNKWTKAGYNFETGKYELVYNLDGTLTTLAEASGELPVGETVHFDLVVDTYDDMRTINFSVNGLTIFNFSDEHGAERGKIGFIVNDNDIYLKEVAYRGDAKPMLAMTDTATPTSEIAATIDVIEQDGRILVPSETGYSRYTTDGGKTWQKGPFHDAYARNMLQLYAADADGNYALTNEVLSFDIKTFDEYDSEGRQMGNLKIWHSSDSGKTWEDWGYVFPENIGETYFATADGFKQGPSGRIYGAIDRDDLAPANVFGEDAGVAQCVYSDDGGRNWTLGGIVDYRDVGTVVNEPQIIESHDGIVTMYYRTDTGMIRCVKSYDRGMSFDVQNTGRTPFLSTANCFGVQVDPTDGKTLYLAWGYDNANLSAQNQLPRQRWAIARSMDDGNTWEYLGTSYECTYGGAKNTVMNLMINVTTDYLVLGAYCLDAELNIHSGGRIDMIRKDSLKATKAFEQLHLSSIESLETYIGFTLDTVDDFIIANDNNSVVFLNGRKVEDAAHNGYILLECVANYMGATIGTNSSGQTTLSYGSKSAVVNGVTTINGVLFVDRESFASQFGFNIYTTSDGICYFGLVDKMLKNTEDRFRNGIEIAE